MAARTETTFSSTTSTSTSTTEPEPDLLKDWQVLVGLAVVSAGLFLSSVDRRWQRKQALKEARAKGYEADTFLGFGKRTFERFGATQRLPKPIPGPVPDRQRSWAVAVLRNILTIAGFRVMCRAGVMSVFVSWWVRYGPELQYQTDREFFTPQSIASQMLCFWRLLEVLVPLTAFSLAGYLHLRLERFHELVAHMQLCRQHLCSLALLVAGVLPEGKEAEPGDIEMNHILPVEVRHAKWMLFRSLNVVHFCAYATVCRRFSYARSSDLLKAGFLLRDEARWLNQSPEQLSAAIQWTAQLAIALVRNELAEHDAAAPITEALRAVRGACAGLLSETYCSAPLSFAHLLLLMVDMTIAFTPPALAYAFSVSSGTGVGVYGWPLLGTMLITGIFHGTLGLIMTLEDPFDSRHTNANPDTVLLTTEFELEAILTGEQMKLPPLPDTSALMESPGDESPDSPTARRRASATVVQLSEDGSGTASPQRAGHDGLLLGGLGAADGDDDDFHMGEEALEEPPDEGGIPDHVSLSSVMSIPDDNSGQVPYVPPLGEAAHNLLTGRLVEQQLRADQANVTPVEGPFYGSGLEDAEEERLLQVLHTLVPHSRPVPLSEETLEQLSGILQRQMLQVQELIAERFSEAALVKGPKPPLIPVVANQHVLADLRKRIMEETQENNLLREQLDRAADGQLVEEDALAVLFPSRKTEEDLVLTPRRRSDLLKILF